MANNKPNYNNRNSGNRSRQTNVGSTLSRGEKTKVSGGVFVYTGEIGLSELSEKINVPVNEIMKFLFLNRKMITINSKLDDECVGMVCLQFGFDFKKEKAVEEENIEEYDIVDDAKSLKERPPVVTVMGHVDHGKTTLIDAIRSSNLVAGEFGGISQAIGAYQRDFKGKKITFIDTPGHEAFTAMRSRGASVTDIIILVVAADDGVMPQTREAIDHAKAAKVPLIVAINKMDKPGANPKRVKDELTQLGIIPEEFGGDTIFLEISAKFNKGIDELLENILTLAEVMELKANPDRYALGTVLEAVLDKGEGPKATLLVQNGTLKNSDYVVVGSTYGKVRRMTNEYQKIVKAAPPSTPVAIIGLSEVPAAGDHFMAFDNEKQAKEIANKRRLKKEAASRSGNAAISLDDLNQRFAKGEVQDLNIVIKADNSGSAEAVKSSLEKINVKGINLNIIRSSAGAITESDIILASASNAIVYGFNVRPSANVRAKADEEKVDIRLHRIIYALIEEIEAACQGMLKPVQVEKVTGQAEVRQIFKVSKVGTIAGSMITSGLIKANNPIRLLRDGVIVYEGKISSMKRYQADVKEAAMGFECGIMLENYNDQKEGDIIEGYELVEVPTK
ncbi:MAG TPA: translation initiation factor IF-2 [Bacilli bacterium]|nr:translation initiation factor IF-2 [Bacilli bacterium]